MFIRQTVTLYALNFYVNLQKVLLEFKLFEVDSIIVGGDFKCPLNPLLDKKGGILNPRFGVIPAIQVLLTGHL